MKRSCSWRINLGLEHWNSAIWTSRNMVVMQKTRGKRKTIRENGEMQNERRAAHFGRSRRILRCEWKYGISLWEESRIRSFSSTSSGPIRVKPLILRGKFDRTQEFFEGGELEFNIKIWNYKENCYEGIWDEKLGRERRGKLQLSRT